MGPDVRNTRYSISDDVWQKFIEDNETALRHCTVKELSARERAAWGSFCRLTPIVQSTRQTRRGVGWER